MTIDELTKAFSRISWFPQWSFEVYESKFEGPYLRIRAVVQNSYNPTEYMMLNIESALPPFENEEELHRWLLWRTNRIAVHESREWLRCDGKPLSDPHEGP